MKLTGLRGTALLFMSVILMATTSCQHRVSDSRPWTTSKEGKSPFTGMRALVVLPENSYYSYDSATYGAFCQLGMDVDWGEPATLEDPKVLGQYDLIATNIKRSFTPAQVAGLKAYLADGGALYGNWGGPWTCPELLRIYGASAARSVYIREMTLLESPLTKGIGERHLLFPPFAGFEPLGTNGHEMVAFNYVDGLKVAKDSEGRCLGILKEHGKGRSAVLGFAPEQYKFIIQDRKLTDQMLENLLGWLIPKGTTPRSWSNVIKVSLPQRAEIISVSVNGAPVETPVAKPVGSLKTLSLPVTTIGAGQTATVCVTYKPLAKARNVETWVHNPCGEFLNAFETPAQAAEFLTSLHVTVVHPLLRYTGGRSICYRGIPGDIVNSRVTKYPGDYLAEYIVECHKRGIKIMGGLYLDWKKYPDTPQVNQTAPALIEKNGEQAKGNLLCPTNPKLQERNLDVVRNLVGNYKLDGLVLDDNFEFDGHPCYCDYCKGQFRAYCEKRGVVYKDPSLVPNTDVEFAALWRSYWKEALDSFLGKVREACAAHGIPAVGGWCGGGTTSIRLAKDFDFLIGMVYIAPPSSVHGPLQRGLGNCGFVTILWGMDRRPADIEEEVVEAIRAGSTDMGFWLAFTRMKESKDKWGVGTFKPTGFALMPGTLDAVARSFGRVEEEWLNYYRDNILGGDPRFVVVSARLERDALTLVVKNIGQCSERRVMGPVDLSAIQ